MIIENAGKLQYSLDQTCQCVVGEVSGTTYNYFRRLVLYA